MNRRGIRADALYLIRAWTRSGSDVVVALIVPVMLLVVFGFVFADAGSEAPMVAVVEEDASDASRAYRDALNATGTVTLVAGGADATGLPDGVSGRVRIPAGFGDATNTTGNATGNATVHVTVAEGDGADARVVLAAAEAAAHRLAVADGPRVIVDVAEVPGDGAKDVPYSSFLLPGVMGLTIITVGIPVGLHSVVELRHAGLLERLAVSPFRKSEWLFARMLGITTITVAATAFLVLVAALVFTFPVRVTPWTLLIVVSGTLVFAGIGTLIGIAVKRPETGGAIMNLVLLPVIFLSGSFFAVERLPEVLQTAALASPLTHVNAGLRADMLHGDAATAMGHALVLVAFAVALLTVGARLVKWTEEQ